MLVGQTFSSEADEDEFEGLSPEVRNDLSGVPLTACVAISYSALTNMMATARGASGRRDICAAGNTGVC